MTAELTSPDEMATELDFAEEITEEAEDKIEDEEADLEESLRGEHSHCKELCQKVYPGKGARRCKRKCSKSHCKHR